jgi:uncharacterized protein (TIGR03066 family)
MRWLTLMLLAACGSSGAADRAPPKAPNTELIVGKFERRPPDGTTIARFQGDGTITIAHDAASLDRKNLATGSYKLEGEQLTLSYSTGEMCKPNETGTYKVVISKIGIRFTKVDDPCADRSKIDGQTWYRAK